MTGAPIWPVLDDYGLHKVPLRFYALLILLLRPYICWVMVLTLPQTQRDMLRWFYFFRVNKTFWCTLRR